MIPVLAISLALSATPGVSDDEGRGFVAEQHRRIRFALSAGAGLGPRWPVTGQWAGTGELSGIGELRLGAVSLRFLVTLRLGGSDDYVPRAILSGTGGVEFRVFPVSRFSLALGVDAGVMGSNQIFTPILAPSFTASVHLGELLQHELDLTATMMWWPSSAPLGGYGLLRYAYFF